MKEYLSRSGLGSISVYTAEEYKESAYAKYLGDVKLEGYVVLILPDEKLHKTMKQSSYFFRDAKSEEEALKLFKLRIEEGEEKWLERLLKTVDFC